MQLVIMTQTIKDGMMPWGYWKIDPKYKDNDFREGVEPLNANQITDLSCDYQLVGVEPDKMFKPGTEPKGFRWWHWDNSMQPWLRHLTPANTSGHKLWSRLTYCGWSMPKDSPALEEHRQRVNRKLQEDSNGAIRDIAELWGGHRPTQLPQKKHALICASSHRNHREFFNEPQDQWLQKVTSELKRQGYTYTIRQKVSVQGRKTNQVTDQIKREGCDLLVTNYSASASEAVVIGCAVVTTTDQNPAWAVSTPWEDFCQGMIHTYTEKDLDYWTTRICAYTWHRTDLNTLRWIDTHPQAEHLRKQKYDI